MRMSLEDYFKPFRQNVIGRDLKFMTAYGRQRLIYADWTASGRLYRPIEDRLVNTFGPLVGNTHTEATVTGTSMTRAYQRARMIIKRHVQAKPDDALFLAGSGMTAAVTLLQRLMGIRAPENLQARLDIPKKHRPMIFVTHLEHHSNHTSWLETIAEVQIIPPGPDGTVDLQRLKSLLTDADPHRLKIAAVTAASNVTGIGPPIHRIARLMHQSGGLCFVDYACAAPYVPINLHPSDPAESLDAIYFSPHKFLGGPGSPGILIVKRQLLKNHVPDRPGGGTVVWTNPWGGHRYLDDIEVREDGGTPPFLQTIRAALTIQLKEQMGIDKMRRREAELLARLWPGLAAIPGLTILAGHSTDRLGVISLTLDGLHYNLVAKLLNDRFGIQTRGGCACAGTYGHYLFQIDRRMSQVITHRLDRGDTSAKPGFVRISIHPTMTNQEMEKIVTAFDQIARLGESWRQDYHYQPTTNEFIHNYFSDPTADVIDRSFSL